MDGVITYDIDTGTKIAEVVFDETQTDVEQMSRRLSNGGYPVEDAVLLNAPPTADAGPDQAVGGGSVVTLDGSASSDPDDSVSHYLWEQTQGTRVDISDHQTDQPKFVAPHVMGPEPELLVFRLTVSDSEYLQSRDTVVVHLTETGQGDEAGLDIWVRAMIHTEEKGPIKAIWQKGGEDLTQGGHQVIWGYFHASPEDVTWGSENNPDVFVKIWLDAAGRIDVNFFHVSVPDIDVYSDHLGDSIGGSKGTATLERRYIRQYYENGERRMEEKHEDGNAPEEYHPLEDPSGYALINDLRIGAVIHTEEKGPVDAVWRTGGEDVTAGGHQVLWGHFHASPSDVDWGSPENPDLFVKIWFDASGRTDVNYFHVSVPDIEVHSDFSGDGIYEQKGTTILDNRYIRHDVMRDA